MSRKRKEIPTYRRHSSGQARIRWNGKDILLGPFGSVESHANYVRVIAEIAGGGVASYTRHGSGSGSGSSLAISVAELVERYLAHVDRQWANRIKFNAVRKKERAKRALGYVLRIYSGSAAEEFGPAKLTIARGAMIDAGYNVRHVNQCVSEIKACWKWAAGVAELVSGDSFHRLAAFPNLTVGESKAPAGRVVPPAPESAIAAVLSVVNPVVAAMIRLQLCTGMRPGEVCQLRACDVDKSGVLRLPEGGTVAIPGVWLYRPAAHKTQHHGHDRVVLIGPSGQKILKKWLATRRAAVDPAAFVFSPAKAWGGNNERHRDRYDVDAYRRCITYAITKTGCTHWHPHQLRHNAGTRIAAEFGPEIARIVLGHRTLAVTRGYVVDDLRRAAEAMAKAG